MLSSRQTGQGVPRACQLRAIDVEFPVAAIRTVPAEPAGLASASRAFFSVAAELVTEVQRRVVGDDNVRTARDNAWAATLEDRARHEARAELTREVAALLARPAPSRRLAKTR
jgi:uncharacterized lipoprotein YmbA